MESISNSFLLLLYYLVEIASDTNETRFTVNRVDKPFSSYQCSAMP
jgi:hypothetical protein